MFILSTIPIASFVLRPSGSVITSGVAVASGVSSSGGCVAVEVGSGLGSVGGSVGSGSAVELGVSDGSGVDVSAETPSEPEPWPCWPTVGSSGGSWVGSGPAASGWVVVLGSSWPSGLLKGVGLANGVAKGVSATRGCSVGNGDGSLSAVGDCVGLLSTVPATVGGIIVASKVGSGLWSSLQPARARGTSKAEAFAAICNFRFLNQFLSAISFADRGQHICNWIIA